MAAIDQYFDAFDKDRSRRAKELSSLLDLYSVAKSSPAEESAARATVVLCYANWEGFYNECVEHFFGFCALRALSASQISWNLLIGVLSADFSMVYNRNNSRDAQLEFLSGLHVKLASMAAEVDRTVVSARSNLNFAKLSENWHCLGMDLSSMQKHRNRIDKELVGWRHAVAHGDSPDLSKMDASRHVSFTSEVMLAVSDRFQERMLDFV